MVRPDPRSPRLTIVLTGGGSAGHVTPNLALLPGLHARGRHVVYLGTRQGMEHRLVKEAGIPFHSIHAGKLRRYRSLHNYLDLISLSRGVLESFRILGRVQPSLVFSKGGFVSCPVVWAAWMRRIPVILHESDLSPGLANRLSMPFARKICHSFPETARYLPRNKAVLTGLPIRHEVLTGSAKQGRTLCGFDSRRPIVLVIGGSLGAERINRTVRAALPDLLQRFQVCLICGKGHSKFGEPLKGYLELEYAGEELPHLLAAASVVVSRAGATTIMELLALGKPTLLIPLSKNASRGDQIDNARALQSRGVCRVLPQEELTPNTLLCNLVRTREERESLINTMKSSDLSTGTQEVLRVVDLVLQNSNFTSTLNKSRTCSD